ncbi:MAG: DUF5752 family protein [Candidatus Bathyarchaeia archaeon]
MKTETSKILRTVPREKAFYFFTSIGNYTGISACSLKEFLEKINEVDVKSLEFHLYRGDFEKWINEVIEDKELADAIKNIRDLKYSGDILRSHIYSVVAKHYEKTIETS